jgi:hypothetical protein
MREYILSPRASMAEEEEMKCSLFAPNSSRREGRSSSEDESTT